MTIDLSELKRGPDPKVPWYADGAIHDGSRVTPVERDLDDLPGARVMFRVAAGTYGVLISDSKVGESWNALIDHRGRIVKRENVRAVSADGSLVAWLDDTEPKSISTLPVVHDLQSGKTIRGKKRGISGVDGFVGAKVLYTRWSTVAMSKAWHSGTPQPAPRS